MTFYEVLDQVIALLQRHGRVTYRALKGQYALEMTSWRICRRKLLRPGS
jgi:hypothetical protein